MNQLAYIHMFTTSFNSWKACMYTWILQLGALIYILKTAMSIWFVPLDPKTTQITVDVFLSCYIFLWRIPPRAFSSQNIACDVFRTRFRLAVYTQFFCKGNSCAICMCIETDKVWRSSTQTKNNNELNIVSKWNIHTHFIEITIIHFSFAKHSAFRLQVF